MARAKYQVLVLPYRSQDKKHFIVFSNAATWTHGNLSPAAVRRRTPRRSFPQKEKPMKKLAFLVTSYSMPWRRQAVFPQKDSRRPGWSGERPAWSSRNIALRWSCPTGPLPSPGNTSALNGSIMQRLSSGSSMTATKWRCGSLRTRYGWGSYRDKFQVAKRYCETLSAARA